VVVTASPLKEKAGDLVQAVSVLKDEALDDARASTLGRTLTGQAGVQSTYFGPGVSRPVIRGLDGGRVQTTSGGLSSMDVSAVSPDHAVSIEPFLADQIEVLKGPSTLLFGPGAIGGVVNVVDGRLRESALADDFSGRAEIGIDSASDERHGSARLDAQLAPFVLHGDIVSRRSSDYSIPGYASIDPSLDERRGRVQNSAVETNAAGLGASWISDNLYAGLGVNRYETQYGVPGEEDASLRLRQSRIDGKFGGNDLASWLTNAKLIFAHNNYTHAELAGREVGTRFNNSQTQVRAELTHQAWSGWRGIFGISTERQELEAIGEEAFVPATRNRGDGFFWLEKKRFKNFSLEASARLDRASVSAALAQRDFRLHNLALAANLHLNESWNLGLSVNRAQRAPGGEELYANGFHAAVGITEIGDPTLRAETSKQFELGLRYEGEGLHAHFAVYHNAFDNFIVALDSGLVDEQDNRIFNWVGRNATFNGFEAQASVHLAENDYGHLDLDLLADHVAAQFVAGQNLPRISPDRLGAGLKWHRNAWRAGINLLHYGRQNKTALFEDSTAGFKNVSANIAWLTDIAAYDVEWFVRGENLGNVTQRLHTSFLKDVAPLPGRSFTIGARLSF
jgi:iron complex outermembrane recepter protein